MAHRVCPWWLGYFLLSPFRRLGQNPENILAPFVQDGMTVLEPGPGMGFFTLELSRKVGASGRVVAVDIQPRMLDRLKRRAAHGTCPGARVQGHQNEFCHVLPRPPIGRRALLDLTITPGGKHQARCLRSGEPSFPGRPL